MMGTLLQDLRYGFRTLLQRPGFTVIAALTLALGIGANTAIFSVINGVLLRPLPYKDPDRLVMLWESNSQRRNVHVSHLNFIDWREQNRSFESISACTGRWGGPSTVTGGSEPDRAYTVGVYPDFFNVLGVAPLVGRTFSPEESNAGTTPVIVISYRFWQRRLGGDPDLADKRLKVGDRDFNVIGVMPADFSFPAETDLWLSQGQFGDETSERGSHNYQVIARLKPNVSLDQARADMSDIAARLEQQYPLSNQGMGAAVISLVDQVVGSVRPALLVLLAGVGFVLLIACANVANLLLARAMARQKEIAVRTALGATRLRIVRQLLTESALLSAVGGALGLLLGYWLVNTLVALSPGTIPRINEVSLDGLTLAFTVGVSLLTSLLFGLLPALRVSKPDLQEALKQGGRTSTSGSSSSLRGLLVISEVALTLVLLIGAGLLIKSFWRLLEVDPGFNPENALTMQVSLPSSEYKQEHQTVDFYRRLFQRIESLPGVESAGMINNLPMGGVNINGPFQIEGEADMRGYGGFRVVSPGYFRAMGIPILRGRAFTEEDNESATAVAIISQRIANATWPDEDPIGKRIRSGMDNRPDVWMTIVGVSGDVRHSGLDVNTTAELYVLYMQRPWRARDMTVIVRTTNDTANIVSALRSEVGAMDRSLPLSFERMEQVFSRSVANRRYNMILLGAFAVAALLLSVLGIYGVMSYTVTQNTREIGVRMALGAQARDVLKLVVGHGLALALTGVAVGVVIALGLTRLMSSLLYGVTATDATTFVIVPAVLVMVALLACYLPARRATKVDPMVALRYE
jgi:putative ABC transport system permease protein